MDFGFKTLNDVGSVQIDQEYSNFALISKTTFATNGSNPSYYDFTFASSSGFPLVAFRCTAAMVGVAWITISGTSWTYRVYTSVSGASVTAYVFDRPPQPPATGFGMIVLDAAGNWTFDSRQKYMTVVGAIDNGSPAEATYTYPSGHNYAVVFCRAGLSVTTTMKPQSNPPAYIYVTFINGGAKITDPSVTINVGGSPINVGAGGGNLGNYGSPASLLVVDVTGF